MNWEVNRAVRRGSSRRTENGQPVRGEEGQVKESFCMLRKPSV